MITVLLTCPACATHLKLRDAPETGKRIRCPNCRTVFAADDAAASRSAAPEATNPTVEFQATAPATLPVPPPVPDNEPWEEPLDRPAKKKGTSWLNVALMGFLLLFVAGAIAFMVAMLTRDASQPQPPGQTAKKPMPPVKQPQPLPKVGLAVGNLAPDIDAEDVHGRRFKLSDFRGKVVFLDFWGDWCPYCRKLYPYKRELMQKLGARPFTVVGVNCERHSNKDQGQQVMQREQINWATWWSPLSEGRINNRWQISGFPNVTILDHRGVIRRRGVYSDLNSWPELTRFIEGLLAERDRDLAAQVGG